jgi:hypothetical protein
MSRLTQTTITGIIKRTIRSLRSDDEPATVADLKAELREQCDDPGRALEVYDRLRKQGEIYTYPADRGELVKITEDRL